MRVRAMSATGAVALAAAGLVALPSGVAQAAGTCEADKGFDVGSAEGGVDGWNDTAVGAGRKDFGTKKNPIKDAGSVTLVFGDSDGSFGTGSFQLTQEVIDSGSSEKNDLFGAAVAIGDLNDDGCKDLAIGSPGENGYGRVVVVFGSPTGMDGSTIQSLSLDSTGVPGLAAANDRFGEAVAITGTGSNAALWVGVPGRNKDGEKGVGQIIRFPAGTAGGKLPTTGIVGFFQGSAGVPGGAEEGDEFGKVLSGSAHSLVVGVPREDLSDTAGTKRTDAGAVYVSNLTGSAWSSFHQNTATPAVPDSVEGGDRFGASVSQIASCTGNAADEAVVVGVPGENFSSLDVVDGGTVAVVDLPAGTTLGLYQGDGIVPGTAETDDSFGLRVLGAGHQLVASAPYEDLGKLDNAGNVFQAVMDCSPDDVPVVTVGSNLSLDTEDVYGAGARGDRFGQELAFNSLNEGVGYPRLVIGTPLKSDGSVLDGGRVTVLTTQVGGLYIGDGSLAFGQSDTRIVGKPKQGDQFGAAIASNV